MLTPRPQRERMLRLECGLGQVFMGDRRIPAGQMQERNAVPVGLARPPSRSAPSDGGQSQEPQPRPEGGELDTATALGDPRSQQNRRVGDPS